MATPALFLASTVLSSEGVGLGLGLRLLCSCKQNTLPFFQMVHRKFVIRICKFLRFQWLCLVEGSAQFSRFCYVAIIE